MKTKNIYTFNESLGIAMKEIVRDTARSIIAKRINDELKNLVSSDDEFLSFECSPLKIGRYCRGETTIPLITLLAFCKSEGISIVHFLSKVFEKRCINWKDYTVASSVLELPDEYEEIIRNIFENREQLLDEFAESISNRKMKSKFAYYGSDVIKRYITLIRAEQYLLYNSTIDLLINNVDFIISNAIELNKPIRVISLGIGDGVKDVALISPLLQKIDRRLEYWIFDISLDMVKIGLDGLKSKLKDKYNRLDRKIFLMDFMDIDKVLINIDSDKQNLFLLLGNTLGNFHEEALLAKIRSVMNTDDLLLIDNQLRASNLSEEDIVNLKRMYDTTESRDYLFAILKNAELHQSDGKLYTETSEDYEISNKHLLNGNCIVVKHNFEITKDVVSKIGSREVSLSKDTIIVVAYSKKYVKQALSNLLSSFFEVTNELCFYSEDGEYALILCRKLNNEELTTSP